MGKGAFINIQNESNWTYIIDFQKRENVYPQTFPNLNGTLGAEKSKPGTKTYQYIEATGDPASFDMVFLTADHSTEVARIHFGCEVLVWWADNPYVRNIYGNAEFQTVIVPGDVRIEAVQVEAGEPLPTEDQYLIKVIIRPSTPKLDRWMGGVKSHIVDTPLCQLPIPGSHDSISYDMVSPHGGSQTQSHTIKEQLDAGIRYFDFRVAEKDDVFYGVHGAASTDIDYTTWGGAKGNEPYVFDDIAEWLDDADHHDELVILCFSHFADFEPIDVPHFAECILYHFGDRLVPKTLGPTATFGQLQGTGTRPKQVIALIRDEGSDKHLAPLWPPSERLWRTSDCWEEWYSDIKYIGGGDLDKHVVETLQWQEQHLDTTPGSHDRDPDKFWVTQPILNCDAALWWGHNLSWWGANDMSPLATYVYEHFWWRGRSVPWRPPAVSHPVAKPNIMIFDYAGDFDGFPAACVRMVTPP